MAGLLGSIFGSKPSVPNYTPTSLLTSQQQALEANQAILPGAEKLAAGVTAFNTDQLTQLLNQKIPGFSANSGLIQNNITSELQGKLPTDVLQELQSSDAAQSLTGGFGGSGLAGNLTARDLGLTSLNLMQQGLGAEESWSSMIDQMFAPGMGNATSMFISPQQQFQATMTNNENQFSHDWLQSQVNAMPDPIISGITGASLLLGKSALNFGGYGAAGGGGGTNFLMGGNSGSFMSDFGNSGSSSFTDFNAGGGGGVSGGITASSSGGGGSILDSSGGSLVGSLLGLL